MQEMQRIVRNTGIVGNTAWIATAQCKWDKMTKNIVDQAHLESTHKARLREVLHDLEECGMFLDSCFCTIKALHSFCTDDNSLVATTVLSYLLPDSRSSADQDKIISFAKVCEHLHVAYC